MANPNIIASVRKPAPRRNRLRVAALTLTFLAARFIPIPTARAQEALRMSMASEQAAEAGKRTGSADYYNLAAGPVLLRFGADFAVEFNDNVNYTSTNQRPDVALRPGVTVGAMLPMSGENQIILGTSVGYLDYLRTPNLSYLFVTPNSSLQMRFFTGDFIINVHDRFSIVEDVAQTPSVSGTGDFGQIENTAGVGVDWDLNKLVLSLGFDHDTVWATDSQFEYLNHNSELLYLRASFELQPTSHAGVELGGGVTDYQQHVLDDNTHFSAGPFYQAQFSPYVGAKLSAGFVDYNFTTNGTPNDLNSLQAYYGDLTFMHQANLWLYHTLSVGRQLQLGTSSDLLDIYYARYTANLTFVHDVPISAHFSYEHGQNSGGGSQETFSFYNPGLTATYQISQKLSAAASYDLYIKRSTIGFADYVQNRLVLDFSYSF